MHALLSPCVSRLARGLAGLALALALAPAQAAAPTYRLTDIGVAAGYSQSFAYALSDDGRWVAGWLQTASGGTTRAFRWSADGGIQVLAQDAGATASRGFGINNSGQVAGESSFSGGRRGATLWASDGTPAALGTLPAPAGATYSSVAFGVANSGAVAGWSDSVDNTRAFGWTAAAGMASLGALPGGTQTRAYAIAADGRAVGWGTSPAGDRGFVSDGSGALQVLPALSAAAGSRSRAFGLSNGNGWVTGDARDPALGDTAFVWSAASGMRALGKLPGASGSFGADVNSSANAVGWNEGGAAGEQGFVWTAADGMLALTDRLDSGATGWQVQRARAINDAGAIVANAVGADGLVHAVLLSPVPEPSTTALWAAAAGLALAWRQARRGHAQ